jgi:hypothetical protein
VSRHRRYHGSDADARTLAKRVRRLSAAASELQEAYDGAAASLKALSPAILPIGRWEELRRRQFALAYEIAQLLDATVAELAEAEHRLHRARVDGAREDFHADRIVSGSAQLIA